MIATTKSRRHAVQVIEALKEHYPVAECALDFESPFQLLIAVILSAQCTDKMVNIVTKKLFARYPTAEKLARGQRPTIERLVHSTGFFRNKAKNIRACAKMLVDKHDGVVPQTIEELLELPGVARKTANVVLGVMYNIPSGVVVDTHVFRLCRRLGLSEAKTPDKMEPELIELLPQEEWIEFSHRLIHHGRQICDAKKPLCDECPLSDLCPQIDVVR